MWDSVPWTGTFKDHVYSYSSIHISILSMFTNVINFTNGYRMNSASWNLSHPRRPPVVTQIDKVKGGPAGHYPLHCSTCPIRGLPECTHPSWKYPWDTMLPRPNTPCSSGGQSLDWSCCLGFCLPILVSSFLPPIISRVLAKLLPEWLI